MDDVEQNHSNHGKTGSPLLVHMFLVKNGGISSFDYHAMMEEGYCCSLVHQDVQKYSYHHVHNHHEPNDGIIVCGMVLHIQLEYPVHIAHQTLYHCLSFVFFDRNKFISLRRFLSSSASGFGSINCFNFFPSLSFFFFLVFFFVFFLDSSSELSEELEELLSSEETTSGLYSSSVPSNFFETFFFFSFSPLFLSFSFLIYLFFFFFFLGSSFTFSS